MTQQQRTIIGIDPGTNLLGYGVIRVTGKKVEYVDMGVLDLRKEKDAYVKLGRINMEVGVLCDKYGANDMAIESPFMGKNAQVIFKLGRAQGAAIIAASQRCMSVFEYAPRKAKVAITGNGDASKEQVSNMIQKILNVELDPKHLDATDALAIAMCHYYQLTNPITSLTNSSSWEKFILANPDRVKK